MTPGPRTYEVVAAVEGVLRDGKTASWVGKTSVRVSGEMGDSQSNPVNVLPPAAGTSASWSPTSLLVPFSRASCSTAYRCRATTSFLPWRAA